MIFLEKNNLHFTFENQCYEFNPTQDNNSEMQTKQKKRRKEQDEILPLWATIQVGKDSCVKDSRGFSGKFLSNMEGESEERAGKGREKRGAKM